MKKNYTSITAFIVLLSLITLRLGAQLSGVVTINSTLPPSASNYTSFTSLATALNSSGVSGPLTVNVTGSYTEQVTFNQITGMSATNTITINGNGNLLTFGGSSGAPHTILLNGTDYLTINNLQIRGTGSYALVCILTNQANYNSFSACSFSCPANGTTSTQIPFVFSASSTAATSGGDAGNYNTVTTSTLFSGYYCIYHYGLSTAPFTHDNSFIDCRITDFYYYGIYGYYAKDMTVRGCTFDRDTRTTYTTMYLVYGYYMQGLMFEQNVIRDLYNGNPSYSGTCYGMAYIGTSSPNPENRNTIRNNIFRDINQNGTTYAFYYNYNSSNDYYHNTISFDNTAATGGSCYGYYYCYGSNGNYNTWFNNNITITQGGSGTKYGMYFSNNTQGSIINNNNYYISSTNGYVGYWTSAATTLSQWQSQGPDVVGYDINPNYANLAMGDLHPTNTNFNNLGAPVNVAYDQLNAPRSQNNPDIGALEFMSNNCSGTPSGYGVLTPTSPICAGTDADLIVNNYTSDVGIGYQWLSSPTSSIGPWTPIPGQTSAYLTTPTLNATAYYGIAVTCSYAVGTNTFGGSVYVATTTTSNVPYYESFEGISKGNELPNCSWYSPDLGATALTYTSSNTLGRNPRTGTNFAAFYYSPAGSSYYYTNGIQLNAGITYSASLWYQTEYYGYNNFTDLSILYGPSQNTTGLIPIASTNGPAVSNVYRQLSNTFMVATSGIYYVAVKATASSGSAQYLNWDDLSITIPCSVNSPSMALATNSTSICGGDVVVISASGADSYTWSTGSNLNSINEMPNVNTNYMVVGANALSGCTTTLTQMILVSPAPSVFAFANDASICSGQSANLSAMGNAINYNWSNGSNGANITVSPTSNTTYTVIGTNISGCSAMATQVITVLGNPTITVASTQANEMCIGDTQVLTASGSAISYLWVANTNGALYQGNPININPTATTIYTVTGTDMNGCSNKTTYTQNVTECTGLKENKLSSTSIYPNPTSGEITIVSNTNAEKTISVADVTGRIVSSGVDAHEVVKINLSTLANGIYYVKIQTGTSMEVVKVVKN